MPASGATILTYENGRKVRRPSAGGIFYDNDDSGFAAEDAQAAIDEGLSDSDTAITAALAVVEAGRVAVYDSMLGSATVDLNVVSQGLLYVVPASKILIITKVIFANPSSTLAAAVDIDIGDTGTLDWVATVNLSSVTTSVGTHIVFPASGSPSFAAAVEIETDVQTGAAAAADTEVFLFGFLLDA